MTRIHKLMIDLETASTENTAAIVQLAAVEFGIPHGVTPRTFNSYIALASCEAYGMHVSIATMEWWDKQDPVLRAKVFGGTTHIFNALEHFDNWCQTEFEGQENIELWSNGADFDCVILKNAYETVGTGYPFDFRKHRCFRTLKSLAPPSLERLFPINPTKHDALEDARNQATIANIILGNLRWMP